MKKELSKYWRDELKEILLAEGFDAVIRKIEEWFGEEEVSPYK